MDIASLFMDVEVYSHPWDAAIPRPSKDDQLELTGVSITITQ